MRQERRREEEEEEDAAAMTTDPVKHFRPICFFLPLTATAARRNMWENTVCVHRRGGRRGGGTEGRGFASFIGVPGNSGTHMKHNIAWKFGRWGGTNKRRFRFNRVFLHSRRRCIVRTWYIRLNRCVLAARNAMVVIFVPFFRTGVLREMEMDTPARGFFWMLIVFTLFWGVFMAKRRRTMKMIFDDLGDDTFCRTWQDKRILLLLLLLLFA